MFTSIRLASHGQMLPLVSLPSPTSLARSPPSPLPPTALTICITLCTTLCATLCVGALAARAARAASAVPAAPSLR